MPTFKLEMFTPKKQFFVGEVDAVTCNAFDGELCVLHGHQPMIVALPPGEIKIKQDGEWKKAFVGDGFMEVRPDDVLVFTHLLEWPKDIDEAKAQLLLEQEKEQLRNAASFSEHRRTEIELQRMMTTLRKRNYNLNI
ncbi:MAG: ATP synthase F1 subunit epsilon [Clostridia bacterium]|nr:ATP synthase F1 subunit epsilon [Clostridia bacterium]